MEERYATLGHRVGQAMVPRTFHFVFGLRELPEPFHLIFYLCLESCRQVNRPSEILIHCHHEPYGPYWDLV